MKKIVILGSTGSIGTQALDIVRQHRDKFEVVGISAHGNIELLKEQIKEFRPDLVCVSDTERAKQFSGEILKGSEGLNELAGVGQADLVVNCIVGAAGFKPTISALRAGKDVALANKESLVMGGEVVMREAKKSGSRIIPIDSEHSAIMQCLSGEKIEEVKKILLTCSGGPFRGKKDLDKISVEETLKHPRWSMGKKITVDSATLMNKGYEIIEAMWLFSVPLEKIEVVIHPQSIIHSMVQYIDGNVKAQMSNTDMRVAIQYALTYPERVENEELDFSILDVKELTFEKPDLETFKCLSYGIEAAEKKGTMPAVVNAANEVAVEYFLEGRIEFVDIAQIIRNVMDEHEIVGNPEIEDILNADEWARNKVEQILNSGNL